MASQFNEKVAMDLKQWNGKYILHMIDMWSRYTISVFIDRKKTTSIVEKLLTHWIGIFGVMKSILTDNGGEFSSDEMREVASILNVHVCTTAGESPFQNRLCERVHAVTDMMLVKLEADYGQVNDQSLLCWANMARNSLQMWNGFSSHQLVFGLNPNLPNIITDTLPALDGSTTSEEFAKHLNLLHSARKAYIQSESDERIRRALRGKVRASEQIFEHGDHVFYKRDGKDRWLGPGKVMFQDGKVVFVRHGGVFVRVSPNRLCKVGDVQMKEQTENTSSDKEREVDHNTEVMTEERNKGNKDCFTECLPTKPENKPLAMPENKLSVKVKDKIQYKLQNTDDWTTATVLSRAGKATGLNKHWYNVQHEVDEEQKSVDLSKVQWKRLDENDKESSVNITGSSVLHDEQIAKQTELQKLNNFDTYEEVENSGQHVLSTRWVITTKNNQTKARLVVRGFEEDFILPRDSPTVGKGSVKIFLAISASMKWTVKTTDIKSAFLQGKQLNRDVYLKPPKESGAPEGIIWKLKHCLYGLKDGARQFYLSVKEELLKLGCKQCSLDPAVFILRSEQNLNGIICCHVDDFLHAGDAKFEEVMRKLRSRFAAGKIEEKNFTYIGFHIHQNENGIILDHSEYMNKIENAKIDPSKASMKDDVLCPSEQTLYRKLIGQINWAVQVSRPDIAFEMKDMSTKLKEATVGDMIRAIKAVNRLKEVKSVVTFPNLIKNTEHWKILVFTDASLGNINNGTGSTESHIIWIVDKEFNCCPLTWQANKIKRVVRSTIAAETLSLQDGLESSYYYRRIIEDILGLEHQTIPIIAYVDNKSVVESVHSTKLVEDKRLRIDIAAIVESLESKEVIDIKWCSGDKQLANCMTKLGASSYDLLDVLHSGKMIYCFM